MKGSGITFMQRLSSILRRRTTSTTAWLFIAMCLVLEWRCHVPWSLPHLSGATKVVCHVSLLRTHSLTHTHTRTHTVTGVSSIYVIWPFNKEPKKKIEYSTHPSLQPHTVVRPKHSVIAMKKKPGNSLTMRMQASSSIFWFASLLQQQHSTFWQRESNTS